jgi:hypothetical protein
LAQLDNFRTRAAGVEESYDGRDQSQSTGKEGLGAQVTIFPVPRPGLQIIRKTTHEYVLLSIGEEAPGGLGPSNLL